MRISETDEFKKDFKKLKKKYASLESDFEIFKEVIIENPTGKGASLTCDCITMASEKNTSFFKARMICRSVRGAKLRVVYMYDNETIELLFIELYFKGNKKNNDMSRIEAIKKELE